MRECHGDDPAPGLISMISMFHFHRRDFLQSRTSRIRCKTCSILFLHLTVKLITRSFSIFLDRYKSYPHRLSGLFFMFVRNSIDSISNATHCGFSTGSRRLMPIRWPREHIHKDADGSRSEQSTFYMYERWGLWLTRTDRRLKRCIEIVFPWLLLWLNRISRFRSIADPFSW